MQRKRDRRMYHTFQTTKPKETLFNGIHPVKTIDQLPTCSAPAVLFQGFYYGHPCALLISKTPCIRWLSKQSSDNTMSNESKHNNTKKETAPINKQATNAILSQMTSPPNILTLSRIIATPYLSYMLISHHHDKLTPANSITGLGDTSTTASIVSSSITNDTATVDTAAVTDTLSTITTTNVDLSSTPIIALSLFLVMGFTDFLDGYIARKFPSTATVLGSYLDPAADKFFIGVMSMTLWYTGALPGMLVGLWVARDAGIFGSAYWLVRQETIKRGRSEGPDDGKSNNGNLAVMDPANTPLKVQASFLSKVNTTLQIGLIALGIAGEVPSIDIPSQLMTSLVWITAGTTVGSTLGYLNGSALKQSGNK